MLELLLIISVVVIIYLIPTIVAFRRRHPNRWIIGALNVTLGGTGSRRRARIVHGPSWSICPKAPASVADIGRCIDLDFDALQPGCNRRARRRHFPEICPVHAVESVEIRDVGEIAGAFDDVIHAGTGGFE